MNLDDFAKKLPFFDKVFIDPEDGFRKFHFVNGNQTLILIDYVEDFGFDLYIENLPSMKLLFEMDYWIRETYSNMHSHLKNLERVRRLTGGKRLPIEDILGSVTILFDDDAYAYLEYQEKKEIKLKTKEVAKLVVAKLKEERYTPILKEESGYYMIKVEK